VDINLFAADHDLHLESTDALVSTLAMVEVLEREGTHSKPGRLLEEAYQTKGLFHWLALGSGSLFAQTQHALRNENRKGKYFTRDSAAIALACREASLQYIDPVFLDAMGKSGCKFNSAVDLGSGSGERLMQILDRFPRSTGIGIDIAGPANKCATADAVRRGYSSRLTFMEGDARDLSYQDEFTRVDLLTSFLMGHDFWPRENCIATLKNLRSIFPNVQRFFLCDTVRILINRPESRHAVTEDAVPIFTLGFEFGHALMDQTIPTLEDWEGVFEEGGWRCVKQHHISPPSLTVLFELEPLKVE
jgi:hypothetical protein